MDNCCNIDSYVPQKQSLPLMPISSGEEKCAPGHYWGAGVRAHYLVHYVISGKGVFYCGTQKHKITKGQIFVIFPGTVVKYQADEKEPWHYAWVTFAGDEAKDIFKTIGLSVQNPVMTVTNGDAIINTLRKMPEARVSDMSVNLNFSSKLYKFLSLMATDEKSNTDNAYFEAAVSYINANYHSKLTVESIAEYVGISRKYLFALFKDNIGISPKDYITDYRIRRAMELLEDNTLPICNVAYSVGYNDQMTFSKVFRQKKGMSPTEYRQTEI